MVGQGKGRLQQCRIGEEREQAAEVAGRVKEIRIVGPRGSAVPANHRCRSGPLDETRKNGKPTAVVSRPSRAGMGLESAGGVHSFATWMGSSRKGRQSSAR